MVQTQHKFTWHFHVQKNISDTSLTRLPGVWNDIAFLQLLDRLVAVFIAEVAHVTSYNVHFSWVLQLS